MTNLCISCSREVSTIANSVIFKCPKCGERIVRCGACRKLSINYKCLKCGFGGL